jgi:hypothetical protein
MAGRWPARADQSPCMQGRIMETTFRVISTDGRNTNHTIDLKEFPTLSELRRIVEPYLHGATMQYVQVLDPETSRDSLDMFVGESAILKRLPVNAEATKLYRAAHMMFHPDDNPDELPAIRGPAVVFARRVIEIPFPVHMTSRKGSNDGHGDALR